MCIVCQTVSLGAAALIGNQRRQAEHLSLGMAVILGRPEKWLQDVDIPAISTTHPKKSRRILYTTLKVDVDRFSPVLG
jgi:hypothetical protein